MKLKATILIYSDDDTVVGKLNHEGTPYARSMGKHKGNPGTALEDVLDALRPGLLELMEAK